MAGGFVAGLTGLSGAEQGYTEGGLSYEELRKHQLDLQGLRALGRAFQSGMFGPNVVPGPGLIPPATPPGSAPGSPVSAAPLPLATPVGGGNGSPAPPSAAGGPPPGFVNPRMVAGQPQNLTGPVIPPGGTGGFIPPEQPAASRAVSRVANFPAAAGGAFGGDGLGLSTSLANLIASIARANPGQPPEVIAMAVTKAMPIMQTQDQYLWRALQLQMQRELGEGRIAAQRDIATGHDVTRETVAGMRPEVWAFHDFLEANPDATPQQQAGFLRSLKPQSAIKTALDAFMEQSRTATGEDPTPEEIADFLNRNKERITRMQTESRERIAAGQEGSRERVAAGRQQTQRDIAGQTATSRENIAEANRNAAMARTQATIAGRQETTAAQNQSRESVAAGRQSPQRVAIDKALKEHPEWAAEQLADYMRSLKPAGAGERKAQGPRDQIDSVREQISSAIRDLENSKSGGASVAGISGRVQRGREFIGGVLGEGLSMGVGTEGTTASTFQTKIRALQMQVPRLLSSTSRLAKDERAHLEEVIKGLGTFTNADQAIAALKYVDSVLERAKQRGTGRPPAQRSSQQPVDLTAEQQDWLRGQIGEGQEFDVEIGGVSTTWIRRGNEFHQVR